MRIENWQLKIVTVGALFIGPGWVAAAEPAPSPHSEPVALRMESFTVPPSSQPLVFVVAKNLQNVPYQGSLTIKAPEGWRLAPSQRQLTLRPGETRRVPFTVERGSSVRSNSYPVEVSATGAGATVVRRQDVVCASAPYFNPTIDGDPSEWKDAIPVTFTSGGRQVKLKNVADELAAVQQAIGKELPLFGCYCAGEIGPLDVSEEKPGILSGGGGWHVMVTLIGQ